MESARNPVRSDCEELLSRFQQSQSVRFQVFLDIWKEMKFHTILRDRSNYKRRAFSRLVLDLACRYFLPPFSFQIRVGALYLLHSCYHCQDCSPREQVRVSLKDWQEVMRWEQDAMEAQHLDAVYILRQLLAAKAFLFTATPTQLCYRSRRSREQLAACEGFMERPCRPQELINAQLLEEMSNIHELYQTMKTSVLPQVATPAAASVSLVQEGLVPRLYDAVLDFYRWQQGQVAECDAPSSQEGASSSQQQCSHRARLLASIKSRAYEEATEASKSRRHRQVELDLPAGGGGGYSVLQHLRVMKRSLRNRTKEQIILAGGVCREAEKLTQISHLVTLDAAVEEQMRNERRLTWRRPAASSMF